MRRCFSSGVHSRCGALCGALVLVTHDRYLIDSLCTDVLGLDGLGGAALYADINQWEAARDAARDALAKAKVPAKEKAPAAQVARKSSKRLTWNEQREWEAMEGKILAAEADVEQCRNEMENPAVLADHERLNAVCGRMHDAQELVQKLYHRWAELEAKQAD